MGERLLCKQEVVGSIPSASKGGVTEGEGLGFGGWAIAVGRGLAPGAWNARGAA